MTSFFDNYRVVAIVQARMSSSRLPGKVLLPIGEQPMLVHVVERARRSFLVREVVVATTTDPSDDPIEQLCIERGYACARGSLHDVLDRYYQAARAFQADVIVRITADCPLIDPQVIDRTLQAYHSLVTQSPAASAECFAANRLPPPWGRTIPIGLDVEVVGFAALARAWREADQPFQREHVMPYFYEGVPVDALCAINSAANRANLALGQGDPWLERSVISPRGFRVAQLHHFPDYGALRWTVDTPADLELLRAVHARLSAAPGAPFTWQDVLAIFEREPELAAVNAHVEHKTAFHVG